MVYSWVTPETALVAMAAAATVDSPPQHALAAAAADDDDDDDALCGSFLIRRSVGAKYMANNVVCTAWAAPEKGVGEVSVLLPLPQATPGKNLMEIKCPLVTRYKRHFCTTTQISVIFCVSKY